MITHQQNIPGSNPLHGGVRIENSLKIGIAGAGGFARFAARAFLQIPGVQITAITDSDTDAAINMAATLDARAYYDYKLFLEDENTDLVYIATPPFLHYQHSKNALLAGKHVICEKPAAFTTREAEELRSLAQALQLLYVVNLMQRYNPLYTIVKQIIDKNILGSFLHGFFENYASDENLKQDHWFWNEKKSGGIFIEHGVHFFDIFSGWLGRGKVISAVQLERPAAETKRIDRVQATVLYRGGVVNFYHGFDQPMLLDRQELRLQFELGELTLYEWIPVKMKLHGLLKTRDITFLEKITGGFAILQHDHSAVDKQVTGRASTICYNNHMTIEYGNKSEKQNRYQQIITAMLQDQWNWIRDRKHIRVVDDSNAVESIRIAEEARAIAQNINIENR